ncbi:RING-box protein 1A-like [Artemia franciscana]|uniref:RING-type domain-containing protein n=1 Tax=Artemia franciscana TaxID=6661 RepID=A0AA88L5A7_ARTSF|nr:hypothetical protein QYM36_006231 [Artemia franciscana]
MCDKGVNIDKSSNNHHTDSVREKKKRFKVVKFGPVSTWAWDVAVETCAICRNNFYDLCIECEAKHTADTEDCSGAWGVCNHAFHLHCIAKWLKTREVCPLDNTPWQYQNLTI